MSRSFPKLGPFLGQVLEETLFAVPSTLGGLALGTPLGYSPSLSPIGGQDGQLEDLGHAAAQKAVDDFFGTSDVDEYPSGPGDFPAPASDPQTA
jgi:hypothetical protein